MQHYPVFSRANLRAYALVLLAWVILSTGFAWLLTSLAGAALSWMRALLFTALAVMSGMSIMFVASLINLRKLSAGFERLAEGVRDPAIPPVWCPVLTLATRSAVQLSSRIHVKERPQAVSSTPVKGENP